MVRTILADSRPGASLSLCQKKVFLPAYRACGTLSACKNLSIEKGFMTPLTSAGLCYFHEQSVWGLDSCPKKVNQWTNYANCGRRSKA